MVDIAQVKEEIYASVATNRNPLYDSHLYWSQKPYNICDILIQAFSKPGDAIYDPFLGSGVTLLQALHKENGRKAVGAEINDAPLFIVETLLKQYDPQEFQEVSQVFLTKIEALQSYYHTSCPDCGGQGVVSKTIFDKRDRQAVPEIKEVHYQCGCGDKKVKPGDLQDATAMNAQEIPRFIQDIPLIPNSKIAVYEGQAMKDIFTGRNFAVIDKVLEIIQDLASYQDLFRYILMSILHLCKITDKHSNSQWPLWIPKTDCVEKNIILLLQRKVKRFHKTITYLQENYTNTSDCQLFHKGSQHISETDIPNQSVDLIITDPPYLGQVMYSEYMQLYKPFLGLDFNLEDEIVISTAPSRKRNEEEYFSMLHQVFQNCSSKLKNQGYLCLYFHDCSLGVWAKLLKILEESHFHYLSQAHIPKSNTLKNIISPKKSLNGDCILFFVKDDTVIPQANAILSIDKIQEQVVAKASILLSEASSLSTPELYDNGLMELLIGNHWLEPLSKQYKTLVEFFEECFTWVPETGRWVA